MLRYGDPTPSILAAAQAALQRFQVVVLQAQSGVDQNQGSILTQAFYTATGQTTQASLNARANQLLTNYTSFKEIVDDPNATDSQLQAVIDAIGREMDISDIRATITAASAQTVIGGAIQKTAQQGLGLVPWYVWALGAGVLLVGLGWRPFKGD